jgi:hypothetical protein
MLQQAKHIHAKFQRFSFHPDGLSKFQNFPILKKSFKYSIAQANPLISVIIHFGRNKRDVKRM